MTLVGAGAIGAQGRHGPVSAWRENLVTVVCVAATVLMLSWSLYVGQSIGVNPIRPMAIHIGIVVLSVVLFVLVRRAVDFPVRVLLFLFLFFVLIASRSGGGLGPVEAVIAQKHLAFAVTTAGLFVLFSRLSDFAPVIRAVRVVLIFSVVMVVVEYFFRGILPIRLSEVPGRAAGLFENPNAAAVFIAFMLPIACLRASAFWRVVFTATALLGVLLTFSRGGLLVWACASAIALYFPLGKRVHLRLSGVCILFGAIVLGVLAFFFHRELLLALTDWLEPFLTADTLARLHLASDASGRERLIVARFAFELIANGEWTGHGVGFTRGSAWGFSVGPHNMFLLMGVEHGVPGLLLFALFVWGLMSFARPVGYWAAVLFLGASVFLHNFFDLPGYGLLFALYWAAGELEVARIQPVRA